MSEVKVNKISPRSGTDVTLGDSGDTFTIPSGATLAIQGTVSGFTSAGIDDNATSVAITISSDEDVTFTEDILLGDSKKAIFGAGSDFEILHNSVTGNLFNLAANPLEIHQVGTNSVLQLYRDPGNGVIAQFYGGTTEAGSIATDTSLLKINAVSALSFSTNNGSEAMRIDSSGNVGIGTASPSVKLEIIGTENAADTQAIRLMENSTQGGFIKYDGNVNELQLGGYNSAENTGIRIARNDATTMFNTAGTERMRIDSSGTVMVGKTASSSNIVGCELQNSGLLIATRASNTVSILNRTTNDGDIVSLRQANVQEGTISVSGSTVSYNGFTGTHWSRFTDNSTPTILRGTVLETLDEMCDWYNLEFDVITQDEDSNDVTTAQKIPHVLTGTQSNGDVITYNHEGTDYQATITKEGDVKHMMSKVSDNSDAKNVYGVFVAYDLDGEGYNDFYVASVGSFVVRIKSGETLAKGDLLQSNGDGTAKVQTDDNIKSSSFAKVLSTTIIETYEDGSYLVPCSLMC